MYEIEITNFQAIDHCKIEIDGFTTLVGQNHLGKSATLRAINAALTNQQGTDFIRWGEKFCEVRIKCPAFDLLWHKELGNNFYEINGSKRTKVGKEEPPAEIQKAGFKLLESGDQKINLNYIKQFNPLFLVDKQDSKAVDLLTSVYGLDVLYDSISICNSAQQENSNQLRIREKDLELVDLDLKKFEGFESIQDQMAAIEQSKCLLDNLDKDLEKLLDWQRSLVETSKLCRLLKPATEIKTPSYEAIQLSMTECQKLRKYQERFKIAHDSSIRLEGVTGISVPKNAIEEASKEAKIVEKLKTWLKSFVEATKDIDRLTKAGNISLPKISSITDPSSIKALKDKCTQLHKTKYEYISIQKDLEEVKLQITEVSNEITKFDRCPLCGKVRA